MTPELKEKSTIYIYQYVFGAITGIEKGWNAILTIETP